MRFIAILIALFTIVGCAEAPDPYINGNIRISSQFTSEQIELVLAGMADWHEATDGAVNLYPQMRDDREGVVISIRPGDLPANHAGDTQLNQIMIDVDFIKEVQGDKFNEAMQTVVEHEIGHAMGIDFHTKSGLMSRYTENVPPCIDSITLKVFCDMWDCGKNAHPTCH
jgi:hypothetical protein